MGVGNSAGKGTSGIDQFGSVVSTMHMKLGSKFLSSLNQDPAPKKAPACGCCRWCQPLPKGWCGG